MQIRQIDFDCGCMGKSYDVGASWALHPCSEHPAHNMGTLLAACNNQNAAPKLLEACIIALHVLDTCTCNNGHERLAADGLRAAIAKAEGQE